MIIYTCHDSPQERLRPAAEGLRDAARGKRERRRTDIRRGKNKTDGGDDYIFRFECTYSRLSPVCHLPRILAGWRFRSMRGKVSRTRDFPSQSAMLIRKINVAARKIEPEGPLLPLRPCVCGRGGFYDRTALFHDRDQRGITGTRSAIARYDRSRGIGPEFLATKRREAIDDSIVSPISFV